jgi:hypothetical protein
VKLKDTNIFVDEDVPLRTSKRKGAYRNFVQASKVLNSEIRDERDHYKVTVSGDRLVYNGRHYTPDNFDMLPEGLRPEEVSTRVIGDDITFFSGQSPFSNHHRCVFTINGQTFTSVEQYFMSQKARSAGDKYSYRKIMETNDPAKQKDLGKRIYNLNERSWKSQAESVMFDGVYAKFTQSTPLGEKLMSTNGRGLWEMNRHDFLGGTGRSLFGEGSTDKRQWKGANKLGKILEQVRCELLYLKLNAANSEPKR